MHHQNHGADYNTNHYGDTHRNGENEQHQNYGNGHYQNTNKDRNTYNSPNSPRSRKLLSHYNSKGEDCAFADGQKEGWSASNCDSTAIRYYYCSSPLWFPDRNRKFEVNVAEYLEEIVLISLDNDNTADFCTDSISISMKIKGRIMT